jgi:AraC family transcriptional activator FtrA
VRAKAANPSTRPHRVAVVTFERMSIFEFSVACEVFGPVEAAELGVPWYDFVVCGERRSVRFDNGLVLAVPRRLTALARANTIVVPPCDDPAGVPPATIAALRRAHARGARIISLCTGAFVLARAGLLDGRRAVTHWAECAGFAAQFPHVTVDPGVLYVDEGDILTSAGSAASIDLCLHVVRCDYGAEIASALARLMVVQPHRDGGQAQYIDAPMPAPPVADPLADTIAWMTEHLDEDLTIAGLAARATMSPRSFARHFAATTGSTPYQWLLRQRIHQAQRLLESTALPVEVVAGRVGLGNAVNLRKHFRRVLGTNPQSYRRSFQAPAPVS